ncbi:MAG: hypothetical protein WBC91_13790 [Phototrophicaceae bacterium]
MNKKQDITPEKMYDRIMKVAELLANSVDKESSADKQISVKKPKRSKV